MEKLLVIGVDTLAGANLALTLADRCELVGISRTAGLEMDGCRTLCIESDAKSELTDSIAAERPRCIVYCGPSCAASWDRPGVIDATVEANCVRDLEQAAEKCGSRMILLSTDAVFAGPRLFHHEIFPTADSSPSATAARCVEQALTTTETLIVRTHLFGWSVSGTNYAERMWTEIADGREPNVSGTSYATPILASDAAEFVWQAYRRKLTGLYHLGGAERTSQWEFAASLARACGAALAKSHSTGRQTPMVNAGEETSLDSRRLQRALSMPLPLLHEGIDRFIKQQESGYRQRLRTAGARKLRELTAA